MKKILVGILLSVLMSSVALAGFENMTPQTWGWIGFTVAVVVIKLYVLYWIVSHIISFIKNITSKES